MHLLYRAFRDLLFRHLRLAVSISLSVEQITGVDSGKKWVAAVGVWRGRCGVLVRVGRWRTQALEGSRRGRVGQAQKRVVWGFSLMGQARTVLNGLESQFSTVPPPRTNPGQSLESSFLQI